MSDEQRSYSLPTETMPAIDVSHHLEDLSEIQSFLEGRGITTKNTRIERYVRYLEGVIKDGGRAVDAERIFKNSAGEPFLSREDWYLYVLREAHELMWILKGLKAHLPVGVDEKLRTIVGGRDFAALDTDSQSRNAQFELRIASYFCQAGCEVDLSTDTDIIALTSRHTFFVECKRIASKNQLAKRLSDARTQLATRMPRRDGERLVLGCVAADVTKVAFAHNGLTFGITNDHSRDIVRERLLGIVNGSRIALSFDSPRKLLCYWLQIHISALIMIPPPATFATRFSTYHIARPQVGRKDARALTAFYDIFESVSREDPRSSPARKLTPRMTVNFVAGSEFSVQDERILSLLAKNPVTEMEFAETVATLTLDGKQHDFRFVEVAMLPHDLIEEWKQDLEADRARAYVSLVGRLYLRRYPYEEPTESL